MIPGYSLNAPGYAGKPRASGDDPYLESGE